MALRQILGDAQRIPHHRVAVDQAGHLAGGENSRNDFQLPPASNAISFSVNGIAHSRINAHGRSDHEE